METVDLFARKEGTIWVRRTTLRSDGLVLKACNTEKGITAAGKKLSFMKVAFSPLGDILYTADHMGNIYKFDLARNRYVMNCIVVVSSFYVYRLRRVELRIRVHMCTQQFAASLHSHTVQTIKQFHCTVLYS